MVEGETHEDLEYVEVGLEVHPVFYVVEHEL